MLPSFGSTCESAATSSIEELLVSIKIYASLTRLTILEYLAWLLKDADFRAVNSPTNLSNIVSCITPKVSTRCMILRVEWMQYWRSCMSRPVHYGCLNWFEGKRGSQFGAGCLIEPARSWSHSPVSRVRASIDYACVYVVGTSCSYQIVKRSGGHSFRGIVIECPRNWIRSWLLQYLGCH